MLYSAQQPPPIDPLALNDNFRSTSLRGNYNLSKPPSPSAGKLVWTGEVPPQKWMNFYTKVLSRFAAGKGLKLIMSVEASPEGGVTKQQAEETKTALRELGLNDDVQAE